MKRKKETDSSSRVYLKSWELKFPWITKGYGANGEGKNTSLKYKSILKFSCSLVTYLIINVFYFIERAVCKWCQKDLDVHSSGLSKHENSAKHKLVAKSVGNIF